MLLDTQGDQLESIRKAEHWRFFEELLQNESLAAPLRDAVNAHIDSAIAEQLPGKRLEIDSTGAGPQIFGRVGSKWLADYKHWHAGKCAQKPDSRDITPERMYGMMLWYVLADSRPERWEAPPSGDKRVYKLLDRGMTPQSYSPDRRMLLELRESLRGHLAKLDALLGNG